MPAAGGTYSLRVEKAGCTSYTLTDIVLTANDLESGVALGTLILYAGDTYVAGNTSADNSVDIADLNLVNRYFNKSVEPFTNGDTNGDGRVDIADLNLVSRNFGKRGLTVKYKR